VKSDILYAPNETAIDNIMAVVLSSVNDHTIPVFKKTLPEDESKLRLFQKIKVAKFQTQ
jgi:hypothetical protein